MKKKKKKKKQRKKRLKAFAERVEFWQAYLNLDSWDAYVEQGSLRDGTLADVSRCVDSRCAVVRLHDADPKLKICLDELAKHEILHLLLSDMSALAHSREATHDQISREEETLVVKLCRLIG